MPLNRRKFLKKSAVTGAGVALAGGAVAPSAQAAEPWWRRVAGSRSGIR